MNIQILYTDGRDPGFIGLTQQLDAELFEIYGDAVLAYQPFNTLDAIDDAVLVLSDGVPVACGGFKSFDAHTVELKRIFVSKPYRRLGLAETVVHALEETARQKGNRRAVLETGADMAGAAALYTKLGYQIIENYGSYQNDDACICMQKMLTGQTENS